MVEVMKINQKKTIIIEKRRPNAENSLEGFLNKNINEFVSKQSLKILEKIDLPYDFLDVDVLLWPENESY